MIARLGGANALGAGEGAELAVAIWVALKDAAAHDDVSVFAGHAVGVGRARPATGGDQ
jgi:hypothetical protein